MNKSFRRANPQSNKIKFGNPQIYLEALDNQLDDLRMKHSSISRKVHSMNDTDRVYPQLTYELRYIERLALHVRGVREEIAAQPQLRALNSSTPPQLGERLLLLILTKEERVNIPGDLAEEFTEIAAKHGERFAKVWYYKQVAASAWPMIRKAVRWGLLTSLGEWICRIL